MRHLALALALTGVLLAQDDAPIRSDVVNVQVPVSVTDKKGRAVINLIEKDFQLFDNGVAQAFALDVAPRPVSLVVAVQANSPTAKTLQQVRQASALLQPLVAGETGEIAVLAFDREVFTLTPFTSNADEINKAFLKLTPGRDDHHLDEAAMEGIRLLNTRGPDRRKVLMLISEPYDRGSPITTQDVFTKAEWDGIIVYAVTMKPQELRPPVKSMNPAPPESRAPLPMGTLQNETTNVQNGGYGANVGDMWRVLKGLTVRNSLDAYTAMTGGSQFNFSNQKNLEEAFDKIGREIHSQYFLTFAPRATDPGYHELTVKVLDRPNLVVRARRGYPLIAAPSTPPR